MNTTEQHLVGVNESPTQTLQIVPLRPRISSQSSNAQAAWFDLDDCLAILEGYDETPADQMEYLDSRDELLIPESVRPTRRFEYLWNAFLDFKDAIGNRDGNQHTVDGCGSHSRPREAPSLEDPSAYGRSMDIYLELQNLRVEVRSIRKLFPPHTHLATDFQDAEILPRLYTIGVKLRNQIDGGFMRLLASRSAFQDDFEMVGDRVTIVPFTERYKGPPVLCTVCQETTDTGADPVALFCSAKDIFHSHCLEELVNSGSDTSNLCPNCRHEFCERRSGRRPRDGLPPIDGYGARVAIHMIWQSCHDFMRLKQLYVRIFGRPPWLNWLKLPGNRPWDLWGTVYKDIVVPSVGDTSSDGDEEAIYEHDSEDPEESDSEEPFDHDDLDSAADSEEDVPDEFITEQLLESELTDGTTISVVASSEQPTFREMLEQDFADLADDSDVDMEDVAELIIALTAIEDSDDEMEDV